MTKAGLSNARCVTVRESMGCPSINDHLPVGFCARHFIFEGLNLRLWHQRIRGTGAHKDARLDHARRRLYGRMQYAMKADHTGHRSAAARKFESARAT